MRDTVLRFLDQLQNSLKQSIDITTRSRKPWEELQQYSEAAPPDGQLDEVGDLGADDDEDEDSDTSYEGNSELAERQSEIKAAITHLYRLSFKMRNASHRSLSTKAISMKQIDPETGEDLFSGYTRYDYQYVLESLQQLRQIPQPLRQDLQPIRRKDDIPTFLLERLSRAMTNRRRYFAYWRRHALKLSRVVPQKNPATSEEAKLKTTETSPAKYFPGQDKLKNQSTQIYGPETVISGTDISKYRSNLDDLLDTETVISYATTAKDIDGKSADLPPPPADASSNPEFVCPYCGITCPSWQGKGKPWRAHILHDLQPYVCTFPDCSDGDRLYDSQGAWMEHERIWHRRVWRCFELQHANALYKSKEQLHLHLSENHPDLTELQIQSMLGLVETTITDSRKACPFCDSTGPFDKGLYNHMAFHQESLARFAAPRNVDMNNDSAGSNKPDGIRSAGSLRSISLHFSDTSDVSDISEDEKSGNLLYAASEEGDEELMKLLLDRGANVNAQGGHYGNALQAASEEGDEELVKLLLDRGANVNAQGGHYGNALQAASYGGHERIMKLLLDSGANVNARGGRYGNALQAASYGGHERTVKLLLDNGANVNAQDGIYGNALQAASYRAHEQTMKLLLDRGANVNAQGGHYGNALQAASNGGHERTVKLLLDSGAKVNAQGGHYGNALQAASCGGHKRITKLLLDSGANVNAQGGHYGNALQAASNGGHERTVKLLLDSGADVNAQGGYYSNALQAASSGDHEQTVKLLLDNGANINMQGGNYGNALQAASRWGHERTVKLLLDSGADVNAQGGDYSNALQAASSGDHEQTVKLLLDNGANINMQGGNYGNAL
ncbi:ankyrin repeat-containing domain protein [Phaeosphaeriaceae sp. PMI808]|nr:ankyrin repeat-containing domain protein [Phaeosphaeriaceae sp. PMI808]